MPPEIDAMASRTCVKSPLDNSDQKRPGARLLALTFDVLTSFFQNLQRNDAHEQDNHHTNEATPGADIHALLSLHKHQHCKRQEVYIYIYIYGPWFGAFDLYVPVFYCFLFLDFVSKLGAYVHMICMHAYKCDKSNDISICNLKEFECIQEYKNHSAWL